LRLWRKTARRPAYCLAFLKNIDKISSRGAARTIEPGGAGTLARLLFAWNSGIKKASIALKDVELACIEKDEQLLPVYASGRGKNTIQKANAGMTRFRDIARAILASNHRSA
jgi:hypothetical protein